MRPGEVQQLVIEMNAAAERGAEVAVRKAWEAMWEEIPRALGERERPGAVRGERPATDQLPALAALEVGTLYDRPSEQDQDALVAALVEMQRLPRQAREGEVPSETEGAHE